ncbi:hypothetical protein GOBAR_AA31355 [Gossypium barbadense]|uniref:Uncharacterized protein n=1 Tax=Gossypium barbadense TaxID=3634 RepID=A0A2P5WE28_GOSBA|nr:hypothetical protein GOBAR_AA31355 [Gossypium barbadense]
MTIFKTPQKSPSLISCIGCGNQVKCKQCLDYGRLHRSSHFSSRELKADWCSSFNGFPHENVVHKRIKLNPSKQLLPSKVEFLDPTSLGICPEPPNWPERDEIQRFTIEQKANNVGISHSLRFIKRKQQGKLGSFVDNASEFAHSSVKNAISSLVLIIREIQNYTLMIRDSSEDLVVVLSKIQKDMTLTFVWLFQQVFSETPILMVYVMLLLANFSVQSMAGKACFDAIQRQGFTQNVVIETVLVSDKESGKEEEDQCAKVRQQLVSPLHAEIEPDNYEVHSKTDLVYQMRIAEEPNNALLLIKLCSISPPCCQRLRQVKLQLLFGNIIHYFQKKSVMFHIHIRFIPFIFWYGICRAEECFKRAIEVEPQDAEALGLYADFLWQVRNNEWAAEEMYIQAAEADTKNPFQASKYANFLWSTGCQGICLLFDESIVSSK